MIKEGRNLFPHLQLRQPQVGQLLDQLEFNHPLTVFKRKSLKAVLRIRIRFISQNHPKSRKMNTKINQNHKNIMSSNKILHFYTELDPTKRIFIEKTIRIRNFENRLKIVRVRNTGPGVELR